MNKLVAITLISCFAFNASAGLCDVPKRIALGEPAPCAGYLMSASTEERIRTELVYKDSLIKNLTEASDAQAEIIRMSTNQIDLYKLEIEKEKRTNLLQKVLYFSLGAVVTYGASKAFSR